MSKISFVLPAYNCAKYIKDCIDSILSQKFLNKYSIEIIIVNDGSTDNTEEVVLSNYKEFNCIKYIYQENSGAPSARNIGIKNATGDWIIFLDSDDKLVTNYLENIDLDKLLKEKYDLIIGNYKKIDEEGNILESITEYSHSVTITGDDIYMLCTNDPKPGSKIYNLNTIKINNLKFDNVKIGQDANFFIKYLANCKKVYSSEEFLYLYRIVNGSISHTYTLKNLKIIETFDKVKEYYSSINKQDIFENYIVFSQLQHYYFQFCKLRFYKCYEDRKIIFYTFKKQYKIIDLKDKKYFSQKNKTYIQLFKFRLLFGVIFTSNAYIKFFNIYKGRR